MKNILLRSVSGIIYVAIIVACILINHWTFLALCFLMTIIGLAEYYSLELHSGTQRRNLLTAVMDIVGGCILVGSFWMLFNLDILHGFAAYLIYLVARQIIQLYIKNSNPVSSLSESFMGQMYISLPISTMMYIYSLSPHLVLAMFIFIWLNDTGAFIVGSSIGRHRLFPRISPKKSWEGFWGGIVFCVAAAFVMKSFWPEFFAYLNIGKMVGFSALVAIFATWGDLVESMFKRSLHVKDSGKIIPGHGGLLDRIDSLLCVAPATACYMFFV